METKELKLNNYNNCLACDAFIQIHFAPTTQVLECDLEKIYHVKHGEEDMYVKLVDLWRLDFCMISHHSVITLPATGMEAQEWKAWWLQKYPQTTSDTKMAVYYYKKYKPE